MGLDMYLYAKKHVSAYEYQRRNAELNEERAAEIRLFDDLVGRLGIGDLVSQDSPHLEVEVCVAYWRKANQIHNWFVQNVQGGVDECQHSYVERTQLVALKELCEEVLVAREMGGDELGEQYARERLETAEGFFFGSTAYDQWYWADLQATVKQLEGVLALAEGWDLYYHSSW